MTSSEIEAVLRNVLRAEPATLDPPSIADWNRIESKFGCRVGESFKAFIELMSRFQFPGDILNVSSGRTNGNDLIDVAFDVERQCVDWNPEMIPFYSIGNGDYFCLNKNECPDSRVYYYYSERSAYEPFTGSFEEWIKSLPEFLA